MKQNETDFGRGATPWYSVGENNSEQIVFLGANGHAVATYPFFMRRLAERYRVDAMECRAVWPGVDGPPNHAPDWNEFAADYLAFLRGRGLDQGQAIHVGHSFGGSVGAMLALENPGLFKRLVVIEPGTSPTFWSNIFMAMLPYSRRRKVGFIKATLARRSEFDSREQFIDSMRSKRTYSGFCEEALNDYGEGGLVPYGDRFRLRFSGQWEGHIFCGVNYAWAYFRKIKVPTLLIRAEHTYLQPKKDWEALGRYCERNNPHVTLQELPGVSHMCVQDNPDLVRDAIEQWLEKTA